MEPRRSVHKPSEASGPTLCHFGFEQHEISILISISSRAERNSPALAVAVQSTGCSHKQLTQRSGSVFCVLCSVFCVLCSVSRYACHLELRGNLRSSSK